MPWRLWQSNKWILFVIWRNRKWNKRQILLIKVNRAFRIRIRSWNQISICICMSFWRNWKNFIQVQNTSGYLCEFRIPSCRWNLFTFFSASLYVASIGPFNLKIFRRSLKNLQSKPYWLQKLLLRTRSYSIM